MYSDINNLVFNTLDEANQVMNSIDKVIETYGSVSVADVYDICWLTDNYKDNRYGWTDSITITLSKTDDNKYLIKLTDPVKFK